MLATSRRRATHHPISQPQGFYRFLFVALRVLYLSLALGTAMSVFGFSTLKNAEPCTTGKRYFAVCQNLRRVHYFGHTTKTSFAVCRQKNTRQRKNTRETLHFAVCQGPAHGKP